MIIPRNIEMMVRRDQRCEMPHTRNGGSAGEKRRPGIATERVQKLIPLRAVDPDNGFGMPIRGGDDRRSARRPSLRTIRA